MLYYKLDIVSYCVCIMFICEHYIELLFLTTIINFVKNYLLTRNLRNLKIYVYRVNYNIMRIL